MYIPRWTQENRDETPRLLPPNVGGVSVNKSYVRDNPKTVLALADRAFPPEESRGLTEPPHLCVLPW